jgi:hypothetical protein
MWTAQARRGQKKYGENCSKLRPFGLFLPGYAVQSR